MKFRVEKEDIQEHHHKKHYFIDIARPSKVENLDYTMKLTFKPISTYVPPKG